MVEMKNKLQDRSNRYRSISAFIARCLLALTWHGMAWRMNELGMENELVKILSLPSKPMVGTRPRKTSVLGKLTFPKRPDIAPTSAIGYSFLHVTTNGNPAISGLVWYGAYVWYNAYAPSNNPTVVGTRSCNAKGTDYLKVRQRNGRTLPPRRPADWWIL